VIEKPPTWQELLASLTPEIHQNLKTAVELGKWPNGERLGAEQVELCLQAIIAYDQRYLLEAERVAYIDTTKVNTTRVETKHCGDA
jgi:uncharacterized protein YeaC (DUF1315 family)